MGVEYLILRPRIEEDNMLSMKNEKYYSKVSKTNVVEHVTKNYNNNQTKRFALKGKNIVRKFSICKKIGHQAKDYKNKAPFRKCKRGNIPQAHVIR